MAYRILYAGNDASLIENACMINSINIIGKNISKNVKISINIHTIKCHLIVFAKAFYMSFPIS